MFKKTKVRSILELLGKNLSGREVSKVLGISRNTVAEVQALFEASDKSWDDISSWDDDRLYNLFYPDKFKYKIRYSKVDYKYVHKELKKTGVEGAVGDVARDIGPATFEMVMRIFDESKG